MMRKRWIVGTALGAGLALTGGGIALAQTNGPDDGDRETRVAEKRAEFAERLADELGLEADRVAEAVETVSEELEAEHRAEREARLREWVDAALAEGRITEEEAAELRERIESGEGIGPGRGRGLGLGHLFGRGDGKGEGPGRGLGLDDAPGQRDDQGGEQSSSTDPSADPTDSAVTG